MYVFITYECLADLGKASMASQRHEASRMYSIHIFDPTYMYMYTSVHVYLFNTCTYMYIYMNM